MAFVNTSQGPIQLDTPEQVAQAINAGLIDLQQGAAAQKAIAGGPANAPNINPATGPSGLTVQPTNIQGIPATSTGGQTNLSVRPTNIQGIPATGGTPQQILDALVARWNAGEFPDEAAMVVAIRNALGAAGRPLTQNAAQEFFTELQTSGRLGEFAPEQPGQQAVQQPGQAPTPVQQPSQVPRPEVTQTGPPDPGDIANRNLRNELFADQPENLLRRRAIGQTFGDLTPFAFQAANRSFDRFEQTDPITSFAGQLAGTAPEQGNRFAAFLGGAGPTRESLNLDLNAILAGNVAGTPGSELFATQFGQDPRQAASAAAQPFLQGLSPRLRSQVGRTISNRFDTRFSQQPDQFQDPQSIVDLFEEFRRGGFFQ